MKSGFEANKNESLDFPCECIFAGLGFNLGLGYLFLTGTRLSQLIGYFVYMSFACTLIPLPTPTYVIALGQVFQPWIVAGVGAIANCLAALAEYYVIIRLFLKTTLQQQGETSHIFQRFAYYFQRAAFACLIFIGLTPIPFEPFRLAAILIRYNLPKYLLAIFIGRFIRYYLVAQIRHFYSMQRSVLMP